MRRVLVPVVLLGLLILPASTLRGADPPASSATQFVFDALCADCHDQYVAAMAGRVHGRVRAFEVQGRAVGCQGCHGPGGAHAESGGEVAFAARPDGADGACLDCHRGKGMAAWRGSAHAAEGLSCGDCHAIHEARAPLDSCRDCHADVLAALQLPSRHPVRDGKMSCASCHDVHGNGVALLAKGAQRVNDACYDCHQDKEGPFVFEHAPVAESCSNCHTAHGSVANNLLTLNEPALCLQCHELHFHNGYRSPDAVEVDVGGIPRENSNGPRGFNLAFATKCTQCHAPVHGSDLPSQTVTNSGALAR
jgi:DmsE family decaheme c-type cytochrome